MTRRIAVQGVACTALCAAMVLATDAVDHIALAVAVFALGGILAGLVANEVIAGSTPLAAAIALAVVEITRDSTGVFSDEFIAVAWVAVAVPGAVCGYLTAVGRQGRHGGEAQRKGSEGGAG